jgi:hypothetical protein
MVSPFIDFILRIQSIGARVRIGICIVAAGILGAGAGAEMARLENRINMGNMIV